MTIDMPPVGFESSELLDELADYPERTAPLERGSRRSHEDVLIDVTPTASPNEGEPRPLTRSERAVLAVAACELPDPDSDSTLERT